MQEVYGFCFSTSTSIFCHRTVRPPSVVLDDFREDEPYYHSYMPKNAPTAQKYDFLKCPAQKERAAGRLRSGSVIARRTIVPNSCSSALLVGFDLRPLTAKRAILGGHLLGRW